jgi:hypothetical protein
MGRTRLSAELWWGIHMDSGNGDGRITLKWDSEFHDVKN